MKFGGTQNLEIAHMPGMARNIDISAGIAVEVYKKGDQTP